MSGRPVGAEGDRDARGYRVAPGQGPRLRADVVDVYVLRLAAGDQRQRGAHGYGGDTESGHSAGGGDGGGGVTLARAGEPGLLQLRRNKDPLRGTWQPIMGHIEPGETAVDAALRELREEAGLGSEDGVLEGVWALEQVHPFFIWQIDCVVLSPRFLAVVKPGWEPRLNAEHDAARWVGVYGGAEVDRAWVWPGQRAAVAEIRALREPGSVAAGVQRVR
ncbi:MAG: NUDIX hydrolase [Planctomycetaceae bacterium]|nr:NUDIX domain-containing protein [Phycisphaerales bacterium]MCE2652654.1 NUDIX hydrolase [Planctomycetaceae bacterium]